MQPTSERDLKSSFLWQCSEKLLSFDTVSSKSNKNCADFFANALNDLGFQTQVLKEPHEKYQIVAHCGPAVDNGLILSGHMDIVPFETQPGWITDPLKLTLTEDKLYGRGTSDMKLFMSHCLEAFRNTDLKSLKKPVVCLFTCDEEVGCLGAKSMAPRLRSLLNQIPLPKKAVIGEPTSFKIINSHKGVVIFEILIQGKAAHSSRPDWGINAILPVEKIISAVQFINQKYRDQQNEDLKRMFPDYPYNHLSLVQIQAGIANNVIPDECRLTLSYRPFPGDDLLGLFEELKAKLLDLQEEIHFHHLISVPGVAAAKNPEFAELLKSITQQKELHSVSFTTDASYFSEQNIDCFICGAGSIEKAHQPNEYMTLNDFLQGPVFVKNLLNHLFQ